MRAKMYAITTKSGIKHLTGASTALSFSSNVYFNAFTLSHWNFIISTSFQWLDITARLSSCRLYASYFFSSRSDSLSLSHTNSLEFDENVYKMKTIEPNEMPVNQIMHSIPFLSLISSNHAHQCLCTLYTVDIQFICLHIKLHFHAFIQCNGQWLFIDGKTSGRRFDGSALAPALVNENVLLIIGNRTHSSLVTIEFRIFYWKKNNATMNTARMKQTIQSNYVHMQCVTLHVCKFNHKITLLHITFFFLFRSVLFCSVYASHFAFLLPLWFLSRYDRNEHITAL